MKRINPRSYSFEEDISAAEDSDGFIVFLTREELAVCASSIGEALEALENWEFGTRVGVTRPEAKAVRDDINALLRQPRSDDDT